MKDFNELIKMVQDLQQDYLEVDPMNGNEINRIYTQLSAVLPNLVELKCQFKDSYEAQYFESKKGKSIRDAENETHREVPEYYYLKEVINVNYRLCDAMKSNLSFIKHEQNHSQ